MRTTEGFQPKNSSVWPEQWAYTRTMGLQTMTQVNQTFAWTFIENALQTLGPIWAAGQWNGPNHIIVITGVESNGTLYVNDPVAGDPRYGLVQPEDRQDGSGSYDVPALVLSGRQIRNNEVQLVKTRPDESGEVASDRPSDWGRVAMVRAQSQTSGESGCDRRPPIPVA
jgi:hypothetical protein